MSDQDEIDLMLDKAKQEMESLQTKFMDIIEQIHVEIETAQENIFAPFHKILDRAEKLQKERVLMLQNQSTQMIQALFEKQSKLLQGDNKIVPIKTTGKIAEVVGAITTGNTAKQTLSEVERPKGTLTKKTKQNKPTSKEDDLTCLPGVGKLMQKKLNEAGITSFEQLVHPTKEEKKALKDFSHLKHFAEWKQHAEEKLKLH